MKRNKTIWLALLAVTALSLLGWFFLSAKKAASNGENGDPYPTQEHGKSGDIGRSSHESMSREEKIRLDREKQAKGPAIFGETGMLTTGASESLGLSQDQFYKVNDLIFKNNKAFEEAMGKRSRLNPNESVPEKNITVYDIPALEDRGDTLLSSFKNGLITELGVAQGTRLYQMFEASQGADRMFGGYGKYDVKLKFEPVDPAKPGEFAANFTYSDPTTGKWLTKFELEIAKFRELFGSTFEFDPVPPADGGK